jgi:hypothetical protein
LDQLSSRHNIPGDLDLAPRRQRSSPTTRPPLGCSRRCHCQTQLLRATLGSANYAPISSRLNNNGYKGLRYTGRPDKTGASLGLSGDGSAEAAPGMPVIIASRGPLGPILAFQLALRVVLASWFPIQVELCTPLGTHTGQGTEWGCKRKCFMFRPRVPPMPPLES